MSLKFGFTAFIIACCFVNATAQQGLKLWYKQPAANWNEALPIGNGKLAAMVFGQASHERLQLNEESIWAGGPHNNIIPGSGRSYHFGNLKTFFMNASIYLTLGVNQGSNNINECGAPSNS